MNTITIQKGSIVTGLSTRPGRACSEFKLHVITPIVREGVASAVGIDMSDGRFAGQVTSRNVSRIVPFGLTVEQGDELDSEKFDLYLVTPSATTAFVEDVQNRPNKKVLVRMQGGRPLSEFAVDAIDIEVASADDLAEFS
jgi:hypothetical protein